MTNLWNKNQSDSPGSSPVAGEASRRDQRLARLGPSISIKGSLSGAEDLLIEGVVEGEISLKENSVTVGSEGRVKADVFSKSICIEGQVEGNLFGEEQIVIRKSGRVEGNLTAPRVTLENGAKFRGSIDMNPQTAPDRRERVEPSSSPAPRSKAPAPRAANASATSTGGI